MAFTNKTAEHIQAAVDAAFAAQNFPSAQPEQQAEPKVTVLPDGSGFMTASMPLPKDHWIYAPRSEWDNVRDEYAECPPPILTAANRQAVTAAVRYAIRGATMCGEDMDFDPDALVQNAVYALCGPFGNVAAHPPAQPTKQAPLVIDKGVVEGPIGTEADVCADILKRQQLGIAKYGTTVRDNPLELREWLQHAYEECLDQAVYLKRAMEELDKAK